MNSESILLKEINQFPLLTREEEIELAKLVKAGDQAARDKLITHNLRLCYQSVIKIKVLTLWTYTHRLSMV